MEYTCCLFHWTKKFDRFDSPISFRYREEDSYSSWIGGLVTLAIVCSAIFFGIWDFVPFCGRKNYSLFYYTINLKQTEEINLYKSKSSIAFDFECSSKRNPEKYENIKLDDLLELNVNYIYYTNNGENKTNSTIGIHNCNESDFYYDYNIIKVLDKNKLNKLKCLNDLNKVIKNRYQERYDNFTYYDINFESKTSSDISMLKDYLLDNDCKIEIYYIDVTVDVEDYERPIKPFLNEVFLQLDPDFHVRMNTFFMNEYFENNDDLFFASKGSPKINNLFSRTEQYFLHRGSNTGENSFARIYIRADTRKMEIRRKYQTLLEFFADTFSFWDYLFLVCTFLLRGYNKMCLNYAISFELQEKLIPIIQRKNKINKYLNFSKLNDSVILKPTRNKSQEAFTEGSIGAIDDKDIRSDQVNKKMRKGNDKDYSIRRFKIKSCLIPILLWDYIWNKINICECNKHCKCCLCESKKKSLYFPSEKIVNEKLDIIHYLNNILFFEKIKDKLNYYYKSPLIKNDFFEQENNINFGYNSDKGFYRYNKKFNSSIIKDVKKNV